MSHKSGNEGTHKSSGHSPKQDDASLVKQDKSPAGYGDRQAIQESASEETDSSKDTGGADD